MRNKRDITIDVFYLGTIDEGIKQLESLRVDFVTQMHRMLERLCMEGIKVINSVLSGVDLDGYAPDATSSFELITLTPRSAMAKLTLEGTDVLFVEFGAGLLYSNPQNPKAGEMGMGVGTYPGQTHAYDPAGWWFTKGGGGRTEKIHSYGNPAYMPMYKASEELRNSVAKIFDEYFG